MASFGRRARGALVLVLLAGVLAVGSPPPAGAETGPSKLSRHDRELLALARANGDTTVTLLIASAKGANRTVARSLEAMGATIGARTDEVDYIRAEVAIGKAEQAARIRGIEAVDVDEIIPLDDPRPDGEAVPNPQPAPGAATPADNPYMPIRDTGADDFVAANPTWDGRGVVVGVLDTGITLDHPALQTTTTGAPKIVDWVTYTAPAGDNDPTWVDMATVVSGPTFTVATTTYTGLQPGTTYRFGTFNERDARLGGEVGSDVNRDGNPTGSSGIFGVLWDGASTVWVDTNQNLNFADEQAMTDYKVNRDAGYFGTDNPATTVREAMPFTVQIDGRNKFVNIGIVSGAHGSHVAGIIAGNGLFGGAMTGAAPGAQLVSVRVCLFIAGCTSHALIEGMIYAAKTANVDVINMSIGGLPALNDGNNTRAVLYNRLIDQYGVQMYFSIGNSGAGLNTAGDPGVVSNVIGVGTYISKATWQANYGSDTGPVDNQHPFSSRGPREDGGFKPDLIAPGAAISTTPLWQACGPIAGTYALPPGYSMFNGTSMASPQAAGVGALLVSAAQQAGIQHQPAQIRQALKSSTRFIPGYGAYEQGNGLIDVGAAWSLMATNSIKPVTITSSVPVNTTLSQFLATPGHGVGIHDREGVTLGQAYTRTYTFTRRSGGGGSTTYNLSLVGNDGTFSLGAASIALAKGSPASLTVNVNPTAYGAHSAILNLDDPSTPGIEYQTLNTVVVPYDFSAAANYAETFSGTIGRNQTTSYFFRVPAGTPAFAVDFSGPSATPGTGQARFLRFHPFGLTVEPSNNSLTCYSPPVAGGPGCNPNSRSVTNPFAGVWEVTVEARRTSDVLNTPYTLTASILGASVSPNPDLIASATIGTPIPRGYTITNLLGTFTGRAVGTALGSARIATPTIAHLEQQAYDVTVPASSTSLRATIGSPSDPGADLDLFVFNCTTGPCVLAGQNADGDSEESVTIANPAAGLWRVVVDGFAVPAGTTTYRYLDVFANPAFGSISITDANALRPAGAAWNVSGNVTAAAAPAAGRVLLGNVQVRTSTNTLVGQGDVIVESVS